MDKNTVLPRVDIIMATENMDGALINAAAAAGAKGIVIAGVGNGNMTKPALEALAAQAKKGIVCVRSTRVTTGEVGRNVEVKDDSLQLRRVARAQSAEGARAASPRAAEDDGSEDDPALLRRVLILGWGGRVGGSRPLRFSPTLRLMMLPIRDRSRDWSSAS